MDNQQGKVLEKDLAWLAGFIDGEGCISVKRHPGSRMRTKNYNYYYPSMRICNTDEPTLEIVCSILRDVGLPFHISRRVPTNAKWLPSWDLEVKGLKRCKRWCDILLPYLRTKRSQAEDMLEFINLRLSSDKHEGYSEIEQILLQRLRKTAPIRPHRLNACQV